MNLLHEIAASKLKDVACRRARMPATLLEKSECFGRSCHSLRERLEAASGPQVIAEIKRRSPSRGLLNSSTPTALIARGYVAAGAAAISVLTDGRHFGGSDEDLRNVRAEVSVPILRKDFIVDEYQILETKAIGADVVLLIAAALTQREIRTFIRVAQAIGLEVLLEVHSAEEADRCLDCVPDMIGVNNRSLLDLSVDPQRSHAMLPSLAPSWLRVSESGLRDAQVIHELFLAGYQGFLIGELFMAADDPAGACAGLVNELHGMTA